MAELNPAMKISIRDHRKEDRENQQVLLHFMRTNKQIQESERQILKTSNWGRNLQTLLRQLNIFGWVHYTDLLLRFIARPFIDLFSMKFRSASKSSSQEKDKQLEQGNNYGTDEEMLSEDENDLSSLSFLREQRLQRDEKDINFKCLPGRTAGKIANEALVETMKFLDRDDLEVLQLTAAKFDMLVAKHFSVVPSRRVETCKIMTKKSGKKTKTKLRMLCKVPQRMVESNSDVHFWLRNCCIDRITFTNFRFSDQLVRELHALKGFSISVCIFDYHTREEKRSPPITEKQLCSMFEIPAFSYCKGAIFCFRKYTASYRPSLGLLLSLPLTTLVIDFEEYICQPDDLNYIVDWLHDENVKEERTELGRSEVAECRTKSLSLKGMEFEGTQFSDLVETLRKKFLSDTKRRAFLFETDYQPEDEYELQLTKNNSEKFSAISNFDVSVSIERVLS